MRGWEGWANFRLNTLNLSCTTPTFSHRKWVLLGLNSGQTKNEFVPKENGITTMLALLLSSHQDEIRGP